MDEASVSTVTRASSVTLSWANRNRTAADSGSWFTASSSSEALQTTSYDFAYKDDGGAWVGLASGTAAFAINSVSVDLSTVPAGERLVRAQLSAHRSGADSLTTAVCHWELSA